MSRCSRREEDEGRTDPRSARCGVGRRDGHSRPPLVVLLPDEARTMTKKAGRELDETDPPKRNRNDETVLDETAAGIEPLLDPPELPSPPPEELDEDEENEEELGGRG